MHALLAHAYHLAQHALLLLSQWRASLGAIAVAAAARLAGLARTPRGAALTACAAALAGWVFLDPGWLSWPPPPVARLPGLALVLLAEAWLLGATRPGAGRLVSLAASALAAWWLARGGPSGAVALLYCLPVFLGLAVALPVARRLAQGDDGLGSAAAGLVLAAGIMLAGASVHWAHAAAVPAAAALVLLGLAEASSALAGTIVMVAACAIVASDRGRLLGVDAACLAPLLAWVVLRRRK